MSNGNGKITEKVIIGVILAAVMGLSSWTVTKAHDLSVLVARLESRFDSHERDADRRITRIENDNTK